MLASKFFKNGVHVPDTKLWRTVEKIEQKMEDEYGEAIAWSFGHKKKLFGGVAIAFFLFMAMVPPVVMTMICFFIGNPSFCEVVLVIVLL